MPTEQSGEGEIGIDGPGPRRSGDDARMAAEMPDRPGSPIPAPGVLLAPIVVLALIVISSLLAPVSFLPLGVSLGVGIPLLVVGVGLFGWRRRACSARARIPLPTRRPPGWSPEERSGAAAIRSIPGGTIGLFGLAVLLDTATGLRVVVLLGLLARSVALAEARYLEAKFGDEYRAYRSRVRRWI